MNHQPVAKPNSVVTLGHTEVGNGKKLAIIAGPCQLESRSHAFDMAGALKEACDKHGVGLIYKTSFDKANRTSAATARGIGLENALPIFADIRKQFGVPVLTDVQVTLSGDVAVVTCTENILTADQEAAAAAFAGGKAQALNVFTRSTDGWRLWVHQAAPVGSEVV